MNKYAIISLGCPKNLIDSEIFANIIEQNDYQKTEYLSDANVIIINTCGFILSAKEESIQTILEAAQYKKNGKCERLIVTGCLIKRYFHEIQKLIPEIDDLVNLKDFKHFADIFSCSYSLKRRILTPPHFAYIRISDGCNNYCSYCAIPYIRGKFKSVPIIDVIAEANYLADIGVKELIVTAQDTAQYGIDIYGKAKLPELLRKLHHIKGFEWIKILYLHPAHITHEIIDTIAELPKICKYFEIPLQHINNDILQSMNRKINKEKIISLLDNIREKIPTSAIRTTFIVGYPGETQRKFIELKDFIIEQKFERLGIFKYSKEEGTVAYDLKNTIPQKIAESRKDELMALQQNISEKFTAKIIRKKLKVIIDKISEDKEFKYEGRTCFDFPDIDGIVYITEGSASIGDIVDVEIDDTWEYDLVGRIVN